MSGIISMQIGDRLIKRRSRAGRSRDLEDPYELSTIKISSHLSSSSGADQSFNGSQPTTYRTMEGKREETGKLGQLIANRKDAAVHVPPPKLLINSTKVSITSEKPQTHYQQSAHS